MSEWDVASSVEKMRDGLEQMADSMNGVARTIRCVGYRMRGWNDMADVVQNQEGREIVRAGLRDVRVWLGEIEPPPPADYVMVWDGVRMKWVMGFDPAGSNG